MQQSTNTENTNLYNQLVSTYSLTAELIENKLKEQKILVEQLLKLDKKIQKSGYNGIRDYILSIESLNISEEEKQLKILSFGRKFFGGLKETERILLLDLYLHKNGRLNSKNFSDKKASSLLKFHYYIINIINIIMQSKLWIKREVATYPNSELLKSLIYILPKIDSYKESLKLQEYYLANINIELFLIELNKEQVINENIDSYILRKIQEFASIKENLLDFKNSLMSKFFNSKITSGLKSGLLTLLAVCAFYTSSSYALSESNIDSKKKRGSGF